jgi:hypothetical protein
LRSIAPNDGAHKVENPEQPRLIRPHANKIESGFGSERRKLVWRIFIRILGDDFFAATEMELVFVEMHELIDFTDEMHFNPAGAGIVDCAVPPLIQIKVSGQLAVDALEQI